MKAGDHVADLSGVDETGEPVRLSDLPAKGPLVVFFYPAAMSPGCTRESCRFRDLAGEFAALGANIVGVSADRVDKQAAFSARHSLGFPLIGPNHAKDDSVTQDSRTAGRLQAAVGQPPRRFSSTKPRIPLS